MRNSSSSADGDRDLAQFFTPSAVAEFMWQALESWVEESWWHKARIIDPAAGVGHLVNQILSMEKVKATNVWAIEIDQGLVRRRLTHARKARFHWGDGLHDRFPDLVPGTFDLVIGNPPFGRMGKLNLPASDTYLWGEFELLAMTTGPLNRKRSPVQWQKTSAELLFLERGLQLANERGLIVYVMPEGFFANQRLQAVRDWILDRVEVLAVVELPDGAFNKSGLHAKTSVIFMRKGSRPHGRVALGRSTDEDQGFERQLERAAEGLKATLRGENYPGWVCTGNRSLRKNRWDVRYWLGKVPQPRTSDRFESRSLGDFIEHITYGPIVTGSRPPHRTDGIPVIRQGDFVETGLSTEKMLRVLEHGPHDPQRSRVRKGDLLMPRSGAGALGKNRLAVYGEDTQANVGCFVDLIRLQQLNPYFVWFFLKSKPGWAQIRSLINGVGTPNINFSEIRSLRIPIIPQEQQQLLELRYQKDVWVLHQRRSQGETFTAEATLQFRRIIAELERIVVT